MHLNESNRKMEAVSTSETVVNFYEATWHNIPEDSHLHKSDNFKNFKMDLKETECECTDFIHLA
jgi:hypothetical protein